MITADVIRSAIFHDSVPVTFGSAGQAVMQELQVREAPRGPTEHAGFYLVHRVPPGRRPKSPDHLPAFSPVDLCGSSHVKCRTFFDLFDAIDDVADHASSNAKATIAPEVRKALFEIVRLQCQIAIKFHDEFPVLAARGTIAIVESVDNPSAGLSKAAVLSVNGTNPGMLAGVFVNNGFGLVCRPIVDDHPFRRADCLCKHAFNCKFQISFFVPYGRDD